MKLLKKISIIITILLSFSSCNKIQLNYDIKVELKENEYKFFELDNESSFELLNIQLIEDQSLFVTLDAIQNNLNIFSWDEGKLIDKIPLNINEKNKIYNPTKFYYHNSDSIFIIDFGENIKLINDSGEILNNYDIGEIKSKKDEYKGTYGYLQLSNNKKFIYTDNKLLYSTEHLTPDGNRFGVFNLQSNQLEELINPPYPTEKLFENDFTDFWYDYDKNTNSIYVSFPLSNSIHKYDLDSRSLVEFRNEFLGHSFDEHYNTTHTDIRYSNIEATVIDNVLKNLNALQRYTSILITENYIIRVFIHQTENEIKKARDFTLYIYSKKGVLLGEKSFQNPTLENEMLLISNAEDFIFSKNDTIFIPYLNPRPDENKILFKSFTISDNIIF